MFRPDAELFRTVNDLAGRWPWFDALGIFGARHLIFLIFLAALLPAALLWRRTRDRRQASRAIAVALRAWTAAGAAFLCNAVIGVLWARPRPFSALKNVHQLIADPLTAKAFPSDHSTASFAVAFTVVAAYPRLGAALLLCAAVVAFSRVLVGVHYPGDVLAGAVAGWFWATVARAVAKRVDRERLSRRLPKRWRAILGL